MQWVIIAFSIIIFLYSIVIIYLTWFKKHINFSHRSGYFFLTCYKRIFHLQVDTDNPAFPRSTAYWWLGCSSAPRGTVGGNARLSDAPHSDEDVGDILFDAGRFGPPETSEGSFVPLNEGWVDYDERTGWLKILLEYIMTWKILRY